MSDANKPTVYGLEIEPLLPHAVPLEAVVVVRTLDAEGDVSIALRSTPGIYIWDKAGLLRAAQVINDELLRRSFIGTGEGDDDEA
jgi:hypothetical protein